MRGLIYFVCFVHVVIVYLVHFIYSCEIPESYLIVNMSN